MVGQATTRAHLTEGGSVHMPTTAERRQVCSKFWNRAHAELGKYEDRTFVRQRKSTGRLLSAATAGAQLPSLVSQHKLTDALTALPGPVPALMR